MTSTTIHYIDKLDDLTADMPEATKLWKRSREARLAGLTRCGYNASTLARVLRTDEATVDALLDGTLDVAYSSTGQSKPLPEVAMTSGQKKLVIAFSKLVAFCERAPAREVPTPVGESVTFAIGTADADTVRNFRKALAGYMKSNAGRNLNTIWRKRALSESRVSIASLAAAIDVDPETVARWVAGLDSPPVSDDSERYYRAMSYLAEGPSVATVQTKAGRSGDIY